MGKGEIRHSGNVSVALHSIGDLLDRYGHGLILRETASGLYRIDAEATDELAHCLDCPSAHNGEVLPLDTKST
jgi:hypothetical protein